MDVKPQQENMSISVQLWPVVARSRPTNKWISEVVLVIHYVVSFEVCLWLFYLGFFSPGCMACWWLFSLHPGGERWVAFDPAGGYG